jgi:hypothetical protein
MDLNSNSSKNRWKRSGIALEIKESLLSCLLSKKRNSKMKTLQESVATLSEEARLSMEFVTLFLSIMDVPGITFMASTTWIGA